MAKKEKNIIKRIFSKKELKLNPELKVAGLKEGDEIGLPVKTKKETKPKEIKHEFIGKEYCGKIIVDVKDILINNIKRTQIKLSDSVVVLSEDDIKYIK